MATALRARYGRKRRPDQHEETCTASGWAVRLGCTDRKGAMACPVCGTVVGAPLDPGFGPRICVIARHPRPGRTVEGP